MRDGLYQLTRGAVCAGFVVEGGRITQSAPILRRLTNGSEQAADQFSSATVQRVDDFYRVLLTGSRDYKDQAAVTHDLAAVQRKFGCRADQVVVIEGEARGLDSAARDAALALGMRIEGHPARWDRYGKSAGHRRNAEMVASATRRPAAGRGCVAYPVGESRGTRGCMKAAESAGLKVWNRTDPPASRLGEP